MGDKAETLQKASTKKKNTAVAYTLWLLCHRLIMGKMKIGFNCCLIAGILTELFRTVC